MSPLLPHPRQPDARAMTPRQARWTFLWSRLWVLLALALSQGLTLLAVLWVDGQNTEQMLQTQARSALDSLVRIAADNTRAYLQTAAQTVTINSQNLEQGLLSADDPSSLTVNFQTLLGNVSQLNGVLMGQSDGRFTFVRRDGPDELGRFVRVIEPRPARQVTTTRWDAAGHLLSQSLAPDPYDPRTRPWYRQARATPDTLIWTEPYVFASSRLPGITVATAQRGVGGNWVVLGADVSLRDLASFLKTVQFSENGRAFISDGQGHAVATSRAWPVRIQGRLPTLTEVADPGLRALLDGRGRLRVPGSTPGEAVSGSVAQRYQVNRQPYAAVMRRVEIQPGMVWTVGVYAPESDFTQGLGSARHRYLLYFGLASLLSGLIAWPVLFRSTRPLAALQHQATTDPLTGLHNRAAFLAQLSETLRARPGAARTRHASTELAVVMLDLDGFKAINDTQGHLVGDGVLRAVGARLLAAVRPGDTLGRLGGDEFALILTGNSRQDIRQRAETVLNAVTQPPVQLGSNQQPLSATAGLAFADSRHRPQEDRALDVLLRADQALIGGKRLGKGRVWLEDEDAPPSLTQDPF